MLLCRPRFGIGQLPASTVTVPMQYHLALVVSAFQPLKFGTRSLPLSRLMHVYQSWYLPSSPQNLLMPAGLPIHLAHLFVRLGFGFCWLLYLLTYLLTSTFPQHFLSSFVFYKFSCSPLCAWEVCKTVITCGEISMLRYHTIRDAILTCAWKPT